MDDIENSEFYQRISKLVDDNNRKGIGPFYSGIVPTQPPPPLKGTLKNMRDFEPMQMIAMRMRWSNLLMPPLPHISAYVTDLVAVVFVVGKDNEPVCIKDDPALFPSDTLISQLHMLIG